jgi:hypothetical protein
VPRWRGRDAQHATISRRQIVALPGGQANDVLAKPAGARCRGQHSRGRHEHATARAVEVIEVMVVTQQHDVDGADCLRGEGGALRLPQHVDGRAVLAAGRIEGWVGQQSQPAELEQGRGATDVSHLEVGAAHRHPQKI